MKIILGIALGVVVLVVLERLGIIGGSCLSCLGCI